MLGPSCTGAPLTGMSALPPTNVPQPHGATAKTSSAAQRPSLEERGEEATVELRRNDPKISRAISQAHARIRRAYPEPKAHLAVEEAAARRRRDLPAVAQHELQKLDVPAFDPCPRAVELQIEAPAQQAEGGAIADERHRIARAEQNGSAVAEQRRDRGSYLGDAERAEARAGAGHQRAHRDPYVRFEQRARLAIRKDVGR